MSSQSEITTAGMVKGGSKELMAFKTNTNTWGDKTGYDTKTILHQNKSSCWDPDREIKREDD